MNWDYDKLFAVGNVAGVKNTNLNRIFAQENFEEDAYGGMSWDKYKNESLSHFNFSIEYIIRLDPHGNVVERLFDRERDMPKPMPELKTGMFGESAFYEDGEFVKPCKFVVIGDKMVYQDGDFEDVEAINRHDDDWPPLQIIEIYSSNCISFGQCVDYMVVWTNPEFEKYLTSKKFWRKAK